MTLARQRPGRPTRAETRRRQSVTRQRASGNVARRKTLPEYLLLEDVVALMKQAASMTARLLMLIQWRAGLRVSEALVLEVKDLDLYADQPVLKVREGKGGKDRMVPIHPELRTALINTIEFGDVRGALFNAHRSTAHTWVKKALESAQAAGEIPHLVAKGFPEQGGLVHDGDLIIPMRHYRDYCVSSAHLGQLMGN